jgi:hypothetical protein
MRLVFILLGSFFSFPTYSQTAEELFIKQVITSRFVYEKPLDLRLSLSDTVDYQDDFIERTGHSIDSKLLITLIGKSQSVNTNKWSDKELPDAFLINLKKTEPQPSYFFDKYKPSTRIDTFRLKDLIKGYQTILKEGGAYNYSRPVFDDTGEYALLAYDHGYNLSGRGQIVVYNFSKGKWTELGPIKSWVH